MTQSNSDQRRPFLSAPSAKRYYAAAAIEEARQRIVRSIARSEGPALLIGAAGSGKSLLLAVLAEKFASRMSVVTLAGAQLCTRRALLQTILAELGLPYRGMDEGELRLSIAEHLRGSETLPANSPGDRRTGSPRRDADGAGGQVSRHRTDAAPRRVLILVDEADALPTRLLEELRVLTNVASEGLPLVSLVLAGSPILEERFADPQLEKFSQRIAARSYLAAFGREETLGYVRSQVAAVGIKPESLFAPDALEAIYSATGGVPRLVNQLGDQLAWMAEETGCAPLDAALVQQAWSELQQLPAPWNTEPPGSASATGLANLGVVEFGDLDGDEDATSVETAEDREDDEPPASIPIAAARGRGAFEEFAFVATFDATEQLLKSFDANLEEFDALELAAEPEPAEEPAEEPAPPAAANPFDEPFENEEIVVDPYAAFESELLRTAPTVLNRLDRMFAADLERCSQRRMAKAPVAMAVLADEASDGDVDQTAASSLATLTRLSQVRLHDEPTEPAAKLRPCGDLLLVEEDNEPAPTVVAGRQFRRLFSCLEAAGSRSLG